MSTDTSVDKVQVNLRIDETECVMTSDGETHYAIGDSDETNDKSGDQMTNNSFPAGKLRLKKNVGMRKCKSGSNSGNKYNRHWRQRLIADSYDADEDQLVCKYCDKRLKDPGNFIRHVRCHENPELFNKCQFCEYKTVGRHTLREHMASKHQVDPDGNHLERNIKCDQCSFTCVSNFQLRNHLYLRHAEKGLKCNICGYSSHSKSVIAIHTKAVHGNNDRPFLCDTCGYCAKTNGVFRNHLKVHSSRRVCDVCGLALTQHSFSGHMKLHSNDVRPHTCHLCPFAARKRYCLKVHLKNVHKIDIDYLDLSKNDAFISAAAVGTQIVEHSYLNVSHNLQQIM